MKANFSNSVSEGDVLAVGDIHARFDVLETLVKKVTGTGAVLIFLGDIIDRGGQDLEVLGLIHDLVTDPEKYGLQAAYCLRGNHEQMFIDTCEDDSLKLHNHWVMNGGNHKQKEQMKEYVSWMKSLPFYMTSGDTLFVHAGIEPGVNPMDLVGEPNGMNSLLWIREPFLSWGSLISEWSGTLKRVVHGHTIVKKPAVKEDRIGIDTGAVFTGRLTVFNSTKNVFLRVQKKRKSK